MNLNGSRSDWVKVVILFVTGSYINNQKHGSNYYLLPSPWGLSEIRHMRSSRTEQGTAGRIKDKVFRVRDPRSFFLRLATRTATGLFLVSVKRKLCRRIPAFVAAAAALMACLVEVAGPGPGLAFRNYK